MSQVITFYSFKGGVGRTMALANVAVLLSQWGYKTLVVDWDLEAPGLENFFKEYINLEKISKRKGLIELLNPKDATEKKFTWKDLRIPVFIPEGQEPIHLLTAGDRSNGYYDRVRNFDIDLFYKKQDGGQKIEQLREEWKAEYDFVLVDSRTGITDNGGICTIQLPDILVLLFTATDIGLNGILDVAQRAVKAQQSLAFERFKLLALPVPTRLETALEFKLSQEWMNKFSKELEPLYYDWLPINVDRLQFVELTKIPSVPYFNFGEKLPVIEQGVNDPAGLGYAYETITALLANNFQSIQDLMNNRDAFIHMAASNRGTIIKRKSNPKVTNQPVKIFISYSHKEKAIKSILEYYLEILKTKGLATFWSDEKLLPGMKWSEEIEKNISDSQVFLILLSKNYLSPTTSAELQQIENFGKQKNILIIPIVLDDSTWYQDTFLKDRFSIWMDYATINTHVNWEEALFEVVQQIEKSILLYQQQINETKPIGEVK